MPVCPNCGHDNPAEVQHCVECGVAMGRLTTPDSHPDELVDDPFTAGGSSATDRAQQPAGQPHEQAGGPAPEAAPDEEELAEEAMRAGEDRAEDDPGSI